jgi:FkbH-like protein
MSSALDLYWLPAEPAFNEKLGRVDADASAAWPQLVELAHGRMDFVRTARLDRFAAARLGDTPPPSCAQKPIRLAVLAASTIDHLLPSLRVAALRRGEWLTIYTAAYGQYTQELMDTGSGLHRFQPNVVLLALDAAHVVGPGVVAASRADAEATVAATMERVRTLWRRARDSFRCQVIHQTVLPIFPAVMGGAEHRLPGSPLRLAERLNAELRDAADAEGVDLLALDAKSADLGVHALHDPVLWLRAKQELSPAAAPLYGDLVMRIVAARLGRSAKCLVLDLDNTLWGGVIGDDGLEGLVLGQGSALGEAYVGFQRYAKALSQRGVILAVCSKNDEEVACSAFDKHPEMVLKRDDIACFVANWEDKPSNVRAIAKRLNIGLDALAFVDDSPFERNIIRRELPMVMVPELPDDPALYARCLADAGYFESLELTAEDRDRNRLYRAEAARANVQAAATDLEGYLRDLEMQLRWRRFDRVGLQRIVQLVNKTNQFNLTTRRYTEAEILAVMDDPRAIGLQLRLVDRFGDNGMISVLIGRVDDDGSAVEIDTWLMSCRVLGRGVEQSALNVLVSEANRLGASRLIGEYRPTAKNGMVREHYRKLGFEALPAGVNGVSRWALAVDRFTPFNLAMKVIEDSA